MFWEIMFNPMYPCELRLKGALLLERCFNPEETDFRDGRGGVWMGTHPNCVPGVWWLSLFLVLLTTRAAWHPEGPPEGAAYDPHPDLNCVSMSPSKRKTVSSPRP